MTSPRKHPSVAFWITVALVVVLVAYPLSLGPACWITSRTGRGASALGTIYAPILSVAKTFPKMGECIRWYSAVGAAVGWEWTAENEWMRNDLMFW